MPGSRAHDIDGIATAGETPVTVAHYLGLTMRLDADLLDWFRTNEGIKRG
jgi:hypothetical protein